MPAAIGASPDTDLGAVDLIEALSICDCIGVIAHLQTWDDLVPWLILCRVTGSKATIVIDQTGDGQMRDEMIGKVVEVHFLDSRPAVGHH